MTGRPAHDRALRARGGHGRVQPGAVHPGESGVKRPRQDCDSSRGRPGEDALLQSVAEHTQPKLLPQSTLGKAVNLTTSSTSTRLCSDISRTDASRSIIILVENDIRPTAIGRKRWLFIGHPQAGWRSAAIYSMLISARRRGLNPQAYLTDVLARLPLLKIPQIHELLPGNWRPDSAASP